MTALVSSEARRGARELGQHVRGWRLVLGLTAEQVAGRAGITRMTLRKIETGDSSVKFENVLEVTRALGILRSIVAATDPLTSDLGRARVGELGRKRAR